MNTLAFPTASAAENFLPVAQTLELLRLGRESAFGTHANILMHRLAAALGVEPYVGKVGGRIQVCTFSRLALHLRGFGGANLGAMILGCPDPTWVTVDATFWAQVQSPLELPFLFACGEEEYRVAKAKVGGRFALVWHPKEIIDFLDAKQPLEYLKGLLRQRFHIGELHPFDHHHPVTDASFLGRRKLMQVLHDNPLTNYALVGPSKMGKTSMVKRYLQPGQKCGQFSGDRRFYIDLYPVPATEWALARALRMGIDSCASAYYDAPENFAGFLEKVRSRHGGTLEIVLDEVDKHCGLEVMRLLIHLAQKRVCRLVLIGRWRLMREAVHAHDDNFARLETVVMEPLSTDEAHELLEKPLTDLGLQPKALHHELRSVVRRLGCVPGHLQEFGCLLIEALPETGGRLTSDTIRRALARVITSSRLVGVLDDLSSSTARAAALIIALYGPQHASLNPVWLHEEFKRRQIIVRLRECIEICNELVIHHLLGYTDGVYRICRWDFIAEGKAERQTFEAMLMDELSLIR